MTLSRNYEESKDKRRNKDGLQSNRMLLEVGDRFSGVRNKSESELCVAADPLSPAAQNGDVSGRYLGNDPTSTESYSTARGWLSNCSTHTKCNETVSGSSRIDAHHSLLPTRCVEISPDGRLYLRLTDGLYGTYITLTHRWNTGTERCKTTTANYEERLLGSGLEELPQLFKDVLVIAQKLGVNYVWIDSICIIQYGDEGADWRREAPKMAQYYQYSIFTIAGTKEDMTDGILVPSQDNVTPWASRLAQLPYRDKNNALAGHFYVYKRKIPLVDDYVSQVRDSILFRRGWILQEWLLSKRIIWYTTHGLFFECQQELPRADDQSQLTFALASSELQSHLQLKASFHHSAPSILDFWYHALEVYSTCYLTQPNLDRVLAVSGLAKEVGAILARSKAGETGADVEKEVFVSGLWLRDIHRGLLWEEDHSAQPWTTKVEGTPSWSWTSLLTQMKWPDKGQGTQPVCKVTAICSRERKKHNLADFIVEGNFLQPTTPMSEPARFDPTNKFSCLHIRGRLHTVHVRGYLLTEENLYTAAFSTAYDPAPKECRWRAICSPKRPEIIAGWGSLEQLPVEENTCADFGVAVRALLVSTRYLRSGILLKRSEPVLDIVFLEVVDGDNGVYRRLGVGRVADRELIRDFESMKEQDIQLI
ncbi:hypothetical protein K505DRAFT_311975 [Melanomma pulvis-pyrius CBS 109.77]|uniref:Heterokaryon incompatibility domain-containing protein n=1 Tax=Melanomma pulvis-pyrius CBS 109.77 TaxID=1314802 RepID=A0A6A6X1U3_9PLEO|nr:hypothetical protein K505DRAFT_311975 [Melanomma pulvis-pyrius CBS 109.77]